MQFMAQAAQRGENGLGALEQQHGKAELQAGHESGDGPAQDPDACEQQAQDGENRERPGCALEQDMDVLMDVVVFQLVDQGSGVMVVRQQPGPGFQFEAEFGLGQQFPDALLAGEYPGLSRRHGAECPCQPFASPFGAGRAQVLVE